MKDWIIITSFAINAVQLIALYFLTRHANKQERRQQAQTQVMVKMLGHLEGEIRNIAG